jgi:mRNA interferase YafQ
MRRIEPTIAFRRDLKRERRGKHKNLDQILDELIETLAADEPLPERSRDHALTGNWIGLRECHVRPDLLLIYEKDVDVLRLVRLGSHSLLFG